MIDCSREGHQPEVNTRVFQAVQQPVCIVIASRSAIASRGKDVPARVLFQSLPTGHREEKFKALNSLTLKENSWAECPSGWHAPFLPASTGAWSAFPGLDDFFIYNGSGVMPGRTWIIAPDKDSLEKRWNKLIDAQQARSHQFEGPHRKPGRWEHLGPSRFLTRCIGRVGRGGKGISGSNQQLQRGIWPGRECDLERYHQVRDRRYTRRCACVLPRPQPCGFRLLL